MNRPTKIAEGQIWKAVNSDWEYVAKVTAVGVWGVNLIITKLIFDKTSERTVGNYRNGILKSVLLKGISDTGNTVWEYLGKESNCEWCK